MQADYQLQQRVVDQLKWEPSLQSEDIAVTVKEGIVILSGVVDTYDKKVRAEAAVKNVKE